MRDIIDKLLILNESTGLAGRKPGDVFRNQDGDEITFNSIEFYPEQGGRLPHSELDTIIEQLPNDITWMNERTGRTGGIAVARFNTDDGEIFFGRFMENIKPNFTGNYVPNHVGDYRYAGKTGLKMQSKVSPQDLLAQKNDLTAEDIVEQLGNTLGTENTLYRLAFDLAEGASLPLTIDPPKDVSFSAFRDYFCEILQPIALQKGQYKGNAGEAAEKFLGGSFEDTTISFDDSKNAGLSDSTMTNSEGMYIKVSSKGGGGATASTGNLVSSIKELEKSGNASDIVEKYEETIELIKEIQRHGQYGAPLYLGIKYDIIDEEDADIIKELKHSKPVNIDKIDNMMLSDNLKKLAKERKTENPDKVNLYFHLLAAVAHKAADEVNEHTDFNKAAADILNNGALVQVYTKAKEKQGKWVLEGFDTIYPGKNIKGVYLSAAKTYYSTGIKGNYTFKIDKGDSKPGKDELSDKGVGREKRSEKKTSNIMRDLALGRNRVLPKDKDTGNVGREKRK